MNMNITVIILDIKKDTNMNYRINFVSSHVISKLASLNTLSVSN